MKDQNKLLDYSEEYKECMTNWRFIIGARFTILGFYLTFNAAFLFQVLNSQLEDYLVKFFISFIAFVSSIFILIIQIRNRELYFQCAERAKQIENENVEGEPRLMTLMDDPRIVHKSPGGLQFGGHTKGLYGLHGLGIIIWGILTFGYLLKILPCSCLRV